MKKPFPFETVYESLANAILFKGLPTNGEIPPVLMIFTVDSAGAIADMETLPLGPLFIDNAGKDVVGHLLSTIVPVLPDNACAVLVSEAYMRGMHKKPDESWKDARKQLPESLADDPEADEIVLIQLYRPDETRMGGLSILPGRKLKYMPMQEHAHMEGRLVPQSISGEKATKH